MDASHFVGGGIDHEDEDDDEDEGESEPSKFLRNCQIPCRE